MNTRSITLTAASVILLAAIILWLRMHTAKQPEDDAPAAPHQAAPVSTKPSVRGESRKTTTVETPENPGSATQATNRATVLTEIQAAAVTYDAKALPRIQPYLLNPDPEIREAAINGMITLGDAAAAPMLREASSHTKDPREAVRMLEAADYVELPSGTPFLRKRTTGAQK